METYEPYIISTIFFAILCAIFFFWQQRKKKRALSGKQKYLMETLELALQQFEVFDLKLPMEANKRNGFSALLEEIKPHELVLDVNGFMPEDCKNKEVSVFFRAKRPEGPVFYAFNSIINDVHADYENSHIALAMPQVLRVEKKRHFVRVTPAQEDISVVGIWPIKPGKRLPKTTSEMGPPLTHYKAGMEDDPVSIENISGAGIALKINEINTQEFEQTFKKGSQLLCLVAYVLNEDDKPIAFWCSGEVMNVRIVEGKETSSMIIGIEFTNWAVLEQSSSEIHWAHNSPYRGAKPILQWVEKIEQRQNHAK